MVRAPGVGVLVFILALAGCGGSDSPGEGGSEQPPPQEQPDPEPDPDPDEEPDPDPDEEPDPQDSPALSIDDVTVEERSGSATLTVRADRAVQDEVWVDYETRDGTATAGSDYQPAAGTLVFPAGSTEQPITIIVLDDSEAEDVETLFVELSNPMAARISDGVAVVSIVDDDPSVCGAPSIETGVARRVFLWKDCSDGVWQLRVTSDGETARFEGRLDAAEAFAGFTPVNTEAGDVVEAPSPMEITFSLEESTGREGFDFETGADAGTCLTLTLPASGTVLVGPNRTALSTPLDLGTLEACERDPDGPVDAAYNFFVVFTDDQRFDTLEHMPNVNDRLVPTGVNFRNAYVPTPLCCPARVSTYSGGYLSQNTGVLENTPPNGGMAAYHDRVNMGTTLQGAGYRTAFVGKWLNDYVRFGDYVPPGWNHFAGRAVWETLTDWSFFRYVLGSSGTEPAAGETVETDGQYHVYFERDEILEFLESTPADQPYFVFWSTTPPHAPAVPDEADREAFADFAYRGRGYGESDLSDKPVWVRSPGVGETSGDDEFVRDQLRSMLAVDRSIGAILDAIMARGELEKTVIVVTSDNGYMWGEHGLWGKNKAYEESLRVPLLVAIPGIEARADDHLVSPVLDLMPTVYDLVGVDSDSDGTSLMPLLRNPASDWRREMFFEKYSTERYYNGQWVALRRGDWKYVEYFDGTVELYDLASDPFELENRADDAALASRRSAMASRVAELMGLSIKPLFRVATGGEVGRPYSLALESWGGQGPLRWSMESGSLPPGLALDQASGEIAGVPERAGSWRFTVRVTGSRLATQAREPQSFVSHEITIEIR